MSIVWVLYEYMRHMRLRALWVYPHVSLSKMYSTLSSILAMATKNNPSGTTYCVD